MAGMATSASTATGTASVTVEPRAASGDGVELSGLVRRFGEREALAGVSATVAAGETLAVFGPNGAGKTTLLRVLATLLRPHAGTVAVLGHELPRDAHAARARIGLVGHEPLLYRELSGYENLAFYARLYGVSEAEERIRRLLEATGMARRAGDPVRSLSRGMVQRLAIARAVLHRPDLLLLDEPRSGLDSAAAALTDALIGAAGPHTRVLVTHDVEGGLAEADAALCLRHGRVVLDGPADALDPGAVRREIR
jgi:heme exporter protein A